jgi:hypothetical protein
MILSVSAETLPLLPLSLESLLGPESLFSIVSFLGCFGAANEKGMLLKTYFVILVVLIILELSVGLLID